MKITVKEIKDTMNMLPIGLYCGRRVGLSLSENEYTSFYDPTKDSITISSGIIQRGFDNVKDESDFSKESAVRTMEYHEVSHAILTPPYGTNRIENIFEDERIEWLLRGYYLGTNFKKQLKYLSGENVNRPSQNPDEEFFKIVRFRYGKKEFVDRVAKIIEAYKDIDGTTDEHTWDEYCAEIMRLYRDIEEEFDSNGAYDDPNTPISDMIENLVEEEEQARSEREAQKTEAPRTKEDKKDENNGGGGNGDSDSSDGNSEGEGEEKGDGQQDETSTNESQSDSKSDKHNPHGGAMIGSLAEIADKVFSSKIDTKFYNAADAILSTFSRKNNSGSGVSGYSGVFNPRNVGRKDYKYFEKSIGVNGNNKFGSCHLNLFIDNSGSFCYNADAINGIIGALAKIEKKTSNFSFDVIKCGSGITETTPETRFMDPNEGTHLVYDETKASYEKHQKKNTMNYNIVLYDGSCTCYGRNRQTHEQGKDHCFKIFDKNTTTFILERSNIRNVEEAGIFSATVVYENVDYCGKLSENILQVLAKAFG